MGSEKLYRYTSNDEGTFSAGKRLLPEELIAEVNEARSWLPKPDLPPGKYRFFLTEKGKNQYEQTLLKSHQKYLPNIVKEEIEHEDIGNIIYEDEWQIVTEKDIINP